MSVNDAAQSVQRSGFPNAYGCQEAPARQLLAALHGVSCTETATEGWVIPAAGWCTSGFGPRDDGQFHRGQDIAAPIGTSIVAASSGTVVKSGPCACRKPYPCRSCCVGGTREGCRPAVRVDGCLGDRVAPDWRPAQARDVTGAVRDAFRSVGVFLWQAQHQSPDRANGAWSSRALRLGDGRVARALADTAQGRAFCSVTRPTDLPASSMPVSGWDASFARILRLFGVV